MCRWEILAVLVAAAFIVSVSCFSFEPVLRASVKVQADGLDINVGSYSIPRVCDWNNDGRKDLIIGQRTDGKVRLYLNSGTDSAPVFITFSYIQANGADISVYGTGCQGAAPEVVDWNGDGKKDLLVGDAAGYVHLFLNEGTDADPVLGAGSYIQVAGTDYKADARAVPCINDWNEDGRKDLLVGRGDGEISVLINSNTDDDPVFTVDGRVYAGVQPIDGGLRITPRIFDWNCDGYKDIVAGEGYGRIMFYENIGTNEDPQFEANEVYLDAGGFPIDLVLRSRPEIVDWTNDGLADLLVGSYDGCIYLFEQEFIFEFESISYDPSNGTTLTWRSRAGDTYTVYYSTDLQNWDVAASSVESGGCTTSWTDTGSVGAEMRCYKIGLAE